jgi:hypothetical protein
MAVCKADKEDTLIVAAHDMPIPERERKMKHAIALSPACLIKAEKMLEFLVIVIVLVNKKLMVQKARTGSITAGP